jgi:hypothetical protein
MNELNNIISIKNLFRAFFYSFVFIYGLYCSFGYLDHDLGWHLKFGQDIVREGKVPRINTSNNSLFGSSWVDHEWASNALMFETYSLFGYKALGIFFAFLTAVFFFLIEKILELFLGELATGSIHLLFFYPLAIFGLLGILPHIGIRIQETTMVFTALEILILIKFLFFDNKKVLLWLLPLFLVWPNLHGGFIIGLFLLFSLLFFKILEFFFHEKKYGFLIASKTKIPRSDLIFLGHVSLLSFLATFFTPYGWRLYEMLFQYRSTYYMTHIEEWVPFYYLPIQYWKLLYTAMFASILVLPLIVREKVAPQGKIPLRNHVFCLTSSVFKDYLKFFREPWVFFCAILFLLLSLKSKRHFPLFLAISAPIIVCFFMDKLDDSGRKAFANKKIYTSASMLIISLIIGFFGIKKFIEIPRIKDPFTSFCRTFPCEAVEFLKGRPEYKNLKMFNEFSWGGYILWTLPGWRTFIDGRFPQYPFMGRTILEERDDFYEEGKSGPKLKEHGIELVFIMEEENWPEPDFFEKKILLAHVPEPADRKYPLKDYLDSSLEWKKIYEDGVAVIYKKK